MAARSFVVISLSLALAACAPGFGPNAGYRDTRVDISTRAVLEPARLAATWHEVAGFYDPAASGCALGLTKVEPLPGERLRLTHFVDDHPEVHAAIRGAVEYQYFFGGQREPVPGYGIHAPDWPTLERLITATLPG